MAEPAIILQFNRQSVRVFAGALHKVLRHELLEHDEEKVLFNCLDSIMGAITKAEHKLSKDSLMAQAEPLIKVVKS